MRSTDSCGRRSAGTNTYPSSWHQWESQQSSPKLQRARDKWRITLFSWNPPELACRIYWNETVSLQEQGICENVEAYPTTLVTSTRDGWQFGKCAGTIGPRELDWLIRYWLISIG